MRYPLGLVLLFVAFAASPTQGQRSSSQPLREYVGKTVAYRIGIPANWQLVDDGTKLTASRGNVMLVFSASDVGTMQTGQETQLSPEEMRRATTAMVLASDSLLLMLMDRMLPALEATPGFRCSPQLREVRELGGQRAGFVRVGCDLARGDSARFEVWGTIKHGVFYSLTFAAEPRTYAGHEPTFSRIRESVVLANSAPGTSAGPTVAAPTAPAEPAASTASTPQPSAPPRLQEHVGRNVAYRLGIPTGWNVTEEGKQLEVTHGSLAIVLVAANLSEVGADRSLQLSPSELRGLSGATAPPQSLLLKLADRFTRAVEVRPGARCTQLSREIRAMAGQQAGFRSLECALAGGSSVHFETRTIIKDGVMYTLTTLAEVSEFDANEPLLERIRESLVLAPTPRRRPRE